MQVFVLIAVSFAVEFVVVKDVTNIFERHPARRAIEAVRVQRLSRRLAEYAPINSRNKSDRRLIGAANKRRSLGLTAITRESQLSLSLPAVVPISRQPFNSSPMRCK